ncbi:MAG TPA: hypothetical protein VFO34_03945 [Candidatus Acidoferrales bacterium]|nr:hypothetical protein [Candidatus Acidoferrales bacterium]
MDSVFLLWYVLPSPDTENENELLIGVYSAEEEARAAIKRLQRKPGFVTALDGFQIHPYELNKDHWKEGFVLTD